jgi:hypothetical protein
VKEESSIGRGFSLPTIMGIPISTPFVLLRTIVKTICVPLPGTTFH